MHSPTASVAFLSDAVHSLVNLAGASFALWMVVFARREPSAAFPYGYGKAEYFSAAFEGALVTVVGAGLSLLAAVSTSASRDCSCAWTARTARSPRKATAAI